MHKTFLTALAAATIFAVGIPVERAVADAAASSVAAVANSSLVREAAIFCGGNGCNPVHTKAEKRRQYQPLGYTKPLRQSLISSFAGIA
ncbi:MAG: hypothetical protein WA837_19025 [Xanthobacteraceae bacterium]